MRLLLYADDIVLLAESAKDLQKMLDIVTQYSRQWRFRVNPKKGKSEVILFGRKPRNKDREVEVSRSRNRRDEYVQISRDRAEKWIKFCTL